MQHHSTGFERRLADRIDRWQVEVERQVDTETSILIFGRRANQPIVLKVIREPGDEWQSGAVLSAFDGQGMVRVLAHTGGAVLLERLSPGTALVDLAIAGSDDRATAVLIDVIGRMSPRDASQNVSTIQEWGRGFDRYAASGHGQIPKQLLDAARDEYGRLCASQSRPRLLHGD